MAERPIVRLIDDFVAAEKTLSGRPDWEAVGQRGEQRLVWPLAVDGLSTGIDLELNAYPNIRDLRFRVMLRRTRCFARLDFVHDESHVNPRGLPNTYPKGLFAEPHIHHWKDNLQYSTHHQLPDRLPVAMVLPANVRNFDAAVRWFCGEYNISQPANDVIFLPSRTQLL